MEDLGLPKGQLNERSALTLLALVNLKPEEPWHQAGKWLIGITPVMDFIGDYYGKKYAQNTKYKRQRATLAEQYAKEREMQMIPVGINGNKELSLTPGKHSELIKDIIAEFGPRYAPGAEVLYVGIGAEPSPDMLFHDGGNTSPAAKPAAWACGTDPQLKSVSRGLWWKISKTIFKRHRVPAATAGNCLSLFQKEWSPATSSVFSIPDKPQ